MKNLGQWLILMAHSPNRSAGEGGIHPLNFMVQVLKCRLGYNNQAKPRYISVMFKIRYKWNGWSDLPRPWKGILDKYIEKKT